MSLALAIVVGICVYFGFAVLMGTFLGMSGDEPEEFE